MKKDFIVVKLYVAFMACVIIALCMTFCSCKTKYVTVPEYRTQYISRTDTVHTTDTVRNEKQTVIREMTKGDSAMLAQYGIRLRESERMLLWFQNELQQEKAHLLEVIHDTIVKTDSVAVPYPVERELTWLQKLKQDTAGAIITLFFALALAYFVIRYLTKK